MGEEESDPVRVLIRDRARQARLTMADLSRHLARNQTYMHQYMRRHSPKVLPEDVRRSLAELLELPEDSLRPLGARRAASAMPAPRAPGFRASPPISQGNAGPRQDVPIFADSAEIDPADATEWADWPSVPVTGPGSFGLWISGSRGRLRPGDMAFVRDSQPPRVGDIVVALMGKEIVAIGDLLTLDEDHATVEVLSETRMILDRRSHRVLKVAWVKPA
jgi:hypothetical protein